MGNYMKVRFQFALLFGSATLDSRWWHQQQSRQQQPQALTYVTAVMLPDVTAVMLPDTVATVAAAAWLFGGATLDSRW